MPKQPPSRGALSSADLLRICLVLARLGIKKIKLTGGEPLVREDLPALVAALKAMPGIEEVSLTTNGLLLAGLAKELARSGLDSVTVSLDTLNPDTYRALTVSDGLGEALSGLEGALQAGIGRVKLNCVPMVGVNESDLVPLAAIARDQKVHVRFIELMPIGPGRGFQRLSTDTVKKRLQAVYGEMTPSTEPLGNGPAVYYSLPGFAGKLGFISAMSACFCASCTRIRLTADGLLKTCLHLDEGLDLAKNLHTQSDEQLSKEIMDAVWKKPTGHAFRSDANTEDMARIMSQIGG